LTHTVDDVALLRELDLKVMNSSLELLVLVKENIEIIQSSIALVTLNFKVMTHLLKGSTITKDLIVILILDSEHGILLLADGGAVTILEDTLHLLLIFLTHGLHVGVTAHNSVLKLGTKHRKLSRSSTLLNSELITEAHDGGLSVRELALDLIGGAVCFGDLIAEGAVGETLLLEVTESIAGLLSGSEKSSLGLREILGHAIVLLLKLSGVLLE
jgi:hypothetical protein